jgi:chromosomal replication initiator protein
MSKIWKKILDRLQTELSAEDVLTWLSPIQARIQDHTLCLWAPNPFVQEKIESRYLARIRTLCSSFDASITQVQLSVGIADDIGLARGEAVSGGLPAAIIEAPFDSRLDSRYSFDNFVEGSSNQLAKAAAIQVVGAMGSEKFNPLVLYGGTGLGKTHLMHASGNLIRANNPAAKVLYVRSEEFISSMVKSLRTNTMDDFKALYRNVDALLIDDVQFFAGKDRTQDEFFHTFNSLYNTRQQIILTCDRYPKELDGLEPRLKSRFAWGLSVAVEPPDFETRTAILQSKAIGLHLDLPDDVAMLIARRMRTNVRELEGALNTLHAHCLFSGRVLNTDVAKEILKDLLTVQDRQVSMGNIQKTVAEFYRVPLQDLLGAKRTRSIARARQVGMALGKELTTLSYKEIGQNYGKRDHTTVMHANKLVLEWLKLDGAFKEEWEALLRRLTAH